MIFSEIEPSIPTLSKLISKLLLFLLFPPPEISNVAGEHFPGISAVRMS